MIFNDFRRSSIEARAFSLNTELRNYFYYFGVIYM